MLPQVFDLTRQAAHLTQPACFYMSGLLSITLFLYVQADVLINTALQ
jgi:hypothetical protein